MGALIAMTAYFKRGVQSRIYDARNYMVTEVESRTAGEYDGPVYKGYEPYYTRTMANVTREATDKTTLLPGGITGIFRKDYDEKTETQMQSETLPPKEFEATTPGE